MTATGSNVVEHTERLWAGCGWGHSFVSSAVTTVGRRGTMSMQLGVVRTTLQGTQGLGAALTDGWEWAAGEEWRGQVSRR